jgi:hypothetical protein
MTAKIYENENDNDFDIDDSSEEFSESENDEKPVRNFDPVKYFTNKELCYYKMIDKFFKKCTLDQIHKMIGIIDGNSEISLRVLDWFVTRYAKKKLDFDSGTITEVFDVHISYKAQLKSYKKRYFDPFRRKKKFHYCYDLSDTTKTINTTIGQMNFFRWAISNRIIEFVEKNIAQVTKAMNTSNKEDKKKKDKKKTDTSKSDDESSTVSSLKKSEKKINVKGKSSKAVNVKATKTIENDEVQITLNFD